MNCQDIAQTLDERDLSRLTPLERAQVGTHLIACRDCARDWELYHRLTAEPVSPMPADLASSCRVQVASSGRRRTPNRTILISAALVVVAAAAAMLAVNPGQLPNRPAAEVHRTAPNPAPALAPVMPVPPGETVPELAPVQLDLPTTFTVQVLLLRHASEDPLIRAHAWKYYEKLIEELRAVPVITLIGPETVMPAGATPDMRINVTTEGMRWLDVQPARPMASWQAMVQINARRSDGSMTPFYTENDGAQVDPACLPAVGVTELPPCRYEAAIAAAVQRVEALRVDYFPDPAFARELQARLKAQMADTALDLPTRLKALRRLVALRGASADANSPQGIRARRLAELGHGATLGWDAAMVHGALQLLAAADPPLRLPILRMLRGVRHSDLVPALIALLQQTDQALRQEAATILTLDFGSDPMAQVALASMVSADPSQVMRQLAQRAQAGDGAWRAHVSSTLKDTNLPIAERLRPALDMLEFFTNENTHAFLGQKDIVMELAVLLPEFWSSRQDALLGSRSVALLQALQPISGPSRPDVTRAIVELNMEALRRSSDPRVRVSAANWLGRWGISAPRVLALLQDLAANDQDPEVKRVAIRSIELFGPSGQPAAR